MPFYKDNLFDQPALISDFVFDEKTTAVFPDMINRSIPGYATLLSLIAAVGSDFISENQRIYDLGCSLGGAALSLQRVIDPSNTIIAVDSSPAMIVRLNDFIIASEINNIEGQQADVLQLSLLPCQLVVMNFLLQFIPPEHRLSLLKSVYQALDDGGVLLLSEKTANNDPRMQHWYERYKASQGYSKMAIARKRESLEKVMITDDVDTHVQRLQTVGFKKITPYYQGLLFNGWIVEK